MRIYHFLTPNKPLEAVASVSAPRETGGGNISGTMQTQGDTEVLATRLVAPLTTNTFRAEGEGSRDDFTQVLLSAPGDGTTVLREGMRGISLEGKILN